MRVEMLGELYNEVGIILQKGLGNHHIFCTAKSRSTNREGLKQLMDDIEEDLRPLEIHTSNYFKMRGGQNVEELYGINNESLGDSLPTTDSKKEIKVPFEYDYEESNYLEVSETYEDDTTFETSKTRKVEKVTKNAETEVEINNKLTTIKKQSTLKIKDEDFEEELKIFEIAAVFHRKLHEIKIKQTSVKNLEQMAKETLRRVAKIRALARNKLRKLNHTRNVYLRKLKVLMKKMKRGNLY